MITLVKQNAALLHAIDVLDDIDSSFLDGRICNSHILLTIKGYDKHWIKIGPFTFNKNPKEWVASTTASLIKEILQAGLKETYGSDVSNLSVHMLNDGTCYALYRARTVHINEPSMIKDAVEIYKACCNSKADSS